MDQIPELIRNVFDPEHAEGILHYYRAGFAAGEEVRNGAAMAAGPYGVDELYATAWRAGYADALNK